GAERRPGRAVTRRRRYDGGALCRLAQCGGSALRGGTRVDDGRGGGAGAGGAGGRWCGAGPGGTAARGAGSGGVGSSRGASAAVGNGVILSEAKEPCLGWWLLRSAQDDASVGAQDDAAAGSVNTSGSLRPPRPESGRRAPESAWA